MSNTQTTDGGYWCHTCRKRVNPIQPDVTCSECGGAFVEEIENDSELFELYNNQREDQNTNNQNTNNENTSSQNVNTNINFENLFMPQGRHIFFNNISDQNFGGFGEILRSLLNNDFDNIVLGPITMTANFGNGSFQLGDYVIGDDLSGIITRLMNQFDQPRGKPPASKKAIESLPLEDITEEEVKNKLNCPVCTDEYKVNEKVLKMPCGHKFHKDCLIPWLNRHNSCPVCRFEIESNDPDYEKHKKQNT